MRNWCEFTTAAPEVASAVQGLLCQYGSGMAYLATIRDDGGPRIHPVSPVIVKHGLFCFLIQSAKRRDLERDGRYALHTFPAEESDDEACLTGIATPVTDQQRSSYVARAAGADPQVEWRLFELGIQTALVIRRPLATSPNCLTLVTRQSWSD